MQESPPAINFDSWSFLLKDNSEVVFEWNNVQNLEAGCKTLSKAFYGYSAEFDSKEIKDDNFVTVTKNGFIIGFVIFSQKDELNEKKFAEDEKYLKLIIVHPDFQKQGLAGQLTFSILRPFPNTKKIYLVTERNNPYAAKYFEELGFKLLQPGTLLNDLGLTLPFCWTNPNFSI